MSNIPTAEVVMWLYEKHGIWIPVDLTDNSKEFYFQPTIHTRKDRDWNDEEMIDQAKSICNWKEWKFNSPTEAYEAARQTSINAQNISSVCLGKNKSAGGYVWKYKELKIN